MDIHVLFYYQGEGQSVLTREGFFFNLQHISLTFINLALNVAEIEVT